MPIINGEIRGSQIRLTTEPLPSELEEAESDVLVVQRLITVSEFYHIHKPGIDYDQNNFSNSPIIL